jgi:hypothetical protein
MKHCAATRQWLKALARTGAEIERRLPPIRSEAVSDRSARRVASAEVNVRKFRDASPMRHEAVFRGLEKSLT